MNLQINWFLICFLNTTDFSLLPKPLYLRNSCGSLKFTIVLRKIKMIEWKGICKISKSLNYFRPITSKFCYRPTNADGKSNYDSQTAEHHKTKWVHEGRCVNDLNIFFSKFDTKYFSPFYFSHNISNIYSVEVIVAILMLYLMYWYVSIWLSTILIYFSHILSNDSADNFNSKS